MTKPDDIQHELEILKHLKTLEPKPAKQTPSEKFNQALAEVGPAPY